MRESLDLDRIASQLEALEETIILRLIDRAQYRVNAVVYEPGKSGFSGEDHASLFEVRLRYHEEMDAVFGRFEVPEERPFTAGLPRPRRIVRMEPGTLEVEDFDVVNLTSSIRSAYLRLVPVICPSGDDGQYGSSVEHDVHALQAISRRVHYGALYVSESKYRGNRDLYDALIDGGDTAAIEAALTRPEVEDRICGRVRMKVDRVQSQTDPSIRRLIDPSAVTAFYREVVIPLTKRGEVQYLLSRRR